MKKKQNTSLSMCHLNKRIIYISVLFSALLITSLLFSNPQGANIVSGDVQIHTPNSHTLEVTTGHQAIINWQDFSIAQGEMTKFIQPDSNSCALNRVVSRNASEIMGSLVANGTVYLINPNGVIFGKDAIVDTAGFLASTLDIMDKNFLDNKDLLFQGDTTSGIVNYGYLEARNEKVILLGHFIDNFGKVIAHNGEVLLAAAQEVLLKPSSHEHLIIKVKSSHDESIGPHINNAGYIEGIQVELQTAGNPYALAVNHSGRIHATGMVEKDGRVFLVAEEGRVIVSGDIKAENNDQTGGRVELLGKEVHLYQDASIDVSGDYGGGVVLVGGDYQGTPMDKRNASLVEVGDRVSIQASALKEGNGGKVICWSDQNILFLGAIYAEGGQLSGDGGFIEVSSTNKYVYVPKKISTKAPFGKIGTLLLDPFDLEIKNDPSVPGFQNPFIDPIIQTSTLSVADLQNHLEDNNVTITNTNPTGGAEDGNINFQASVSWINGTTLTVNALTDINIVATTAPVIISTHAGSMVFTAGRDLVVTGGTSASAAASLSSVTGNLTFDITRNVTLTGGNGTNAYAQIGVGPTTATTISSDITFNTIGGNLSVLANTGGGDGSYAQIGHAPQVNGNATVTGNITFPNSVAPVQKIGGTVTVTGGDATNNTAIIGHGNELSSNLISCQGDVQFFATGAMTMNGGSGTNAHAVIGFHNPENSTKDFSCTSTNIQTRMETTNITLTAGNNTNAVIGYYNDSTLTGTINISLGTVTVVAGTAAISTLTLTGGNGTGNTAGVAAIGAYASSGTLSTAIIGNFQTLTMTSSSTGEGKARIINHRQGATFNNKDITLGSLFTDDITILGPGASSGLSLAEIRSSHDILLLAESEKNS